jgi:integrase-like protein
MTVISMDAATPVNAERGFTCTRARATVPKQNAYPAESTPALRPVRAAVPNMAGNAAAGPSWEDWNLVWCQRNGHPIDTHDDWVEWKALLVEAGILKDARLHDARHTAGTLLGELHVDIHVIQKILGHAQVTTTRMYTDPTDPLTREAADSIGGLLWPDARQGQGDEPAPARPSKAGGRRSARQTATRNATRAADGAACNRITAGQLGWGARGSNPEPTD